MKELRTKRGVFFGFLFAFVYGAVIAGGCATTDSQKVEQSSTLQTSQDKRITQVVMNETAGEAHVLVTGTEKLVYSAVKQPNPPAVIFYFPDTVVDVKMPINTVAGGLIPEIELTELTETGHTTRLEIKLATDASYTVKQDEKILDIGLQKSVVGTEGKAAASSVAASENKQAKTSVPISKDRASIRNIEYQGEINGKSQVVVATSKRVQYKIKRVSPRWLRLFLLNCDLPEGGLPTQNPGSQNGVVTAIVPVMQTSQPDEAQIDIRLRETVPYLVKQDDGYLYILFDLPEAGIAKKEKKPEPPATVEASGKENVPKEKAEVGKKGPEYTGEKIALDFYNTDIHNVFRILADISGENFAIDKDVEGRVTLSLDNPVPWDRVLDLVLKMNQLDKRQEGNIIRIATLSSLKKESDNEAEKLKAARNVAMQAPLKTEYIQVNYADAGKEIKPHIEAILTKNLDGSGRGSLSVDARNNLIILTDVESTIERAREIVKSIDKVTPQVLIEARIVETDINFSREIGINWDMAGGIQGDSPRAGIGPQRGFDTWGGTRGWNIAQNLPVTPGLPTFGFNFTKIAGTPFLLDAKLMAMEDNGDAKIISAPRVLTLDNEEAIIVQGLEFPYFEESESGGRTVKFKEIDLRLTVIPHITPDERISIELHVIKDDVFDFFEGVPVINTKEAKTRFLMNNNDTLVIGGINKTTERDEETGIPWLSDIPVLGFLFKTKMTSNKKEELLIFITPKIRRLEQRDVTTLTKPMGLRSDKKE
ncbi:MAG: hypothetical protein BA867_10245 [Desulfobacterales bacterium S5133MH16]|nr:MAG: hypothetical protein BA867_10245 [Desulfobacterales bacterium S5133MH16]